jgi:hypothetical protein
MSIGPNCRMRVIARAVGYVTWLGMGREAIIPLLDPAEDRLPATASAPLSAAPTAHGWDLPADRAAACPADPSSAEPVDRAAALVLATSAR